jgi:hypothetical protein
VTGGAQARASARICLCLGREHRVIQPGAALWAWPALSAREIPAQCPPLVAAALLRTLADWRAGLCARPCLICRRGHWLVVRLDHVEVGAWSAQEEAEAQAPLDTAQVEG